MLQIRNKKKSPSKNLHSNTKITTASEQSLSLPLSANYYAISFLWLNSSLLANNEKAIMAKLCSYYPLHFMQAVIIVNPTGLLYHVRGSREENGVGWCMANWKCHSYLFISTSRPLCACMNLVRTYTQPPQTYMIPPGCPLACTFAAPIYFPSSTWITNLLLGEKGRAGGRGGGLRLAHAKRCVFSRIFTSSCYRSTSTIARGWKNK